MEKLMIVENVIGEQYLIKTEGNAFRIFSAEGFTAENLNEIEDTSSWEVVSELDEGLKVIAQIECEENL